MLAVQNNYNIRPAPSNEFAEKCSSEAITAIRGVGIILLASAAGCLIAGLQVPAIALLVAGTAALIFGFGVKNSNEETPVDGYRPTLEEVALSERSFRLLVPTQVHQIKRIIQTPGLRKLKALVELKIITPHQLAEIREEHLFLVSQILRYSFLTGKRSKNVAESDYEYYRIAFSTLSADRKQKIRELVDDASREDSKLRGVFGQSIPLFAASKYGIEKIPQPFTAEQMLAMDHPHFPDPVHMQLFNTLPMPQPLDL